MVVLDIGNTNQNADWIKTPETKELELRIHDELVVEYAKSEKSVELHWLSLKGRIPGWGSN